MRSQMACRSWVGGGPLDGYGVTGGFASSGLDYGYMNQWAAPTDPAPSAPTAVGCGEGTGDQVEGGYEAGSGRIRGGRIYRRELSDGGDFRAGSEHTTRFGIRS